MSVRFNAQIVAAATDHHLDPRLLAAVAAQETGGPGANSGRNIVGDAGHGHGLFQIDDRSWAFARSPQAMDPSKNAEMAATILADNLHTYGGDIRAALSAYNAGSPHAVGTRTTWGDGKTLGYADSVFRHYAQLAGDFAARVTHPSVGSAVATATATANAATPRGPAPQANLPPQAFAASLLGQMPTAIPAVPNTGAFGGEGLGAGGLGVAGLAAPGALQASAPASQFTQPVPWSKLTSAGDEATNEADRSTAELVDTDGIDVFDDGSSDDA